MSRGANFSQELVATAAVVMRCNYCRAGAPTGDRPQPGWVGDRYMPGRGVVVILQNPGAAPANYGTVREASVQRLLREFTASPSVESHERLMRFMLADMVGDLGDRPWAKWTHPISKLIPDRERLAWMNVVKFRTPGVTRKDDPVTQSDLNHGVQHLERELRILDPIGIVTIGAKARSAMEMLRLPPEIVLGHLKLQGSSNVEVMDLRRRLLDAGADI